MDSFRHFIFLLGPFLLLIAHPCSQDKHSWCFSVPPFSIFLKTYRSVCIAPMPLNRRRESELRLETLGRLSEFYSEVAHVNKRPDSEVMELDNMSRWDAKSDSSEVSTFAVLFDKPPPSGLYAEERTTSDDSAKLTRPSERPDTVNPSGGCAIPMDSSPLMELYNTHAESDPPQDFSTSRLRPATSLHQTQQPGVLGHGGLHHSPGEYAGNSSPKVPEPPSGMPSTSKAPHRILSANTESEYSGEDIRMRTRHSDKPYADLARAIPRGSESISGRPIHSAESPRASPYIPKTIVKSPVSKYTAYRPQPAEPSREAPVQTARPTNSREPEAETTYNSARRAGENVRSTHSAARHPDHPILQLATSTKSRRNPQSNEPLRMDNPSPNAREKVYRRSIPTTSMAHVDGISFEMLSPTAVVSSPSPSPSSSPVPAPISSPTLTMATMTTTTTTTTTTTHGRHSSISSSTCPSSPSPAYGAWTSDQPRQKRASLLDRAQEFLGRSVQEQLVKAGQRPPPSFKVNSVTKTTEARGYFQDGATQTVGLYRDASTQTPGRLVVAAPLVVKERWNQETISDNEEDVRAALFFIATQQAVATTRELELKGSRHSSPVGVVEFEASVLSFRGDEGGESANSNDDSLFLGQGPTATRYLASHSFFSSDYAQRSAAALMEKRQRHRQLATAPASRPVTTAIPPSCPQNRDPTRERRKVYESQRADEAQQGHDSRRPV
ncbi:hypothetical protein GGR50DRAFT_329861 [Xylaria sp. CBS 124048]|nr:hypothetical protein GGR50DRAFT_329861 [Xylaria sp. CBS 124048]